MTPAVAAGASPRTPGVFGQGERGRGPFCPFLLLWLHLCPNTPGGSGGWPPAPVQGDAA
jgi:hypothetical protein